MEEVKIKKRGGESETQPGSLETMRGRLPRPEAVSCPLPRQLLGTTTMQYVLTSCATSSLTAALKAVTTPDSSLCYSSSMTPCT